MGNCKCKWSPRWLCGLQKNAKIRLFLGQKSFFYERSKMSAHLSAHLSAHERFIERSFMSAHL